MIPGMFAAQAVPQGPRLWTPADLPEPPAIWSDWDSPLTEVSGAASAWTNIGAAGGSWQQVSSSARPAVISGAVGGRRALRWDGVNDIMSMTTTAARNVLRNVPGGWALMVARRTSLDVGSADRVLLSIPAGVIKSRFAASISQPSFINRLTLTATRLDSDPEASMRAPAGDTEWHVHLFWVDYSGGQAEIRTDGEVEVSGPLTTSGGNTSDTESVYGITLGGWSTGSGNFAFSNASVACILIGSGAMVESDFQKLEGWAAWQCGLEGNLPVGHPYKDAPPYV